MRGFGWLGCDADRQTFTFINIYVLHHLTFKFICFNSYLFNEEECHCCMYAKYYPNVIHLVDHSIFFA